MCRFYRAPTRRITCVQELTATLPLSLCISVRQQISQGIAVCVRSRGGLRTQQLRRLPTLAAIRRASALMSIFNRRLGDWKWLKAGVGIGQTRVLDGRASAATTAAARALAKHRCQHHAPFACAPAVIRWGVGASSDAHAIARPKASIAASRRALGADLGATCAATAIANRRHRAGSDSLARRS